MPTIALPTLSSGRGPSSVSFGYASNTLTHTSAFTKDEQTIELPGVRWACVLTYNNLLADEYPVLAAALAQLRGKSGRINVPVFQRRTIQGAMTGAPVVNGAGQTGNTLNISGAPVSATVFKVGDFFSVAGRVKMVVANCTSNASGQAAVTFEPPILSAPSNGTAIVYAAPTILMRLTEDAQKWVIQPGNYTDTVTFDLIESLT